jgi:glycosyltransferase involved in cell wall biosynthesis
MPASDAKPPPLDPARVVVSVVIPCHDEIEALPALFAELRSLPRLLHPSFPELVFIDDGSTDGTVHALQDFAAGVFFSCKVLGVAPCAGIGNAMREAAWLVAGDVVVTYDADRPYPLADAAKLVAALAAGHDVATASPYVEGGAALDSIPRHRLLMSRAASFLYRLRLGRRAAGIHTFTCGFRAWRKEAFLACLPSEDGFAATAEMLLIALRSGRRVAQVPSTLRPREAGASKMRPLAAALRHARLLVRGLEPRAARRRP